MTNFELITQNPDTLEMFIDALVDDALEAAGCTFDLKLRQEAQGKTDDDPFLSWGDWLKQQSDGDCIYVPGKLDIEKWEKADGN